MEEKLDFEINKLEIGENDILNVSFPEESKPDERYRVAKTLKDKLKEKIGRDIIIFVTTENYKLEKISEDKLKEMKFRIDEILEEKYGNCTVL